MPVERALFVTSRSLTRRIAVPVPPALLTLALGLWGITREDSVWRDEAVTWQVAQRSVAQIWHMLAEVDVVHGLYYVLMHGVFEVFGVNVYTLRMPSVLAMMVATAAVAAIGRRLAGPWAGLTAGLVFAVIPNVQRYAQEGRGYAMVAAAVAVATWLLVGSRDRWWRWAGYTAAMLTAALLNWFSLFALPAHALTALMARRRGHRPFLAPWSLCAAVVVAGALPLVLASRAQAGQVAWIRPTGVSTYVGVASLLVVALICARVPYGPGVPTVPGGGAPAMSPASVGLPLLAVPQGVLLLLSLIEPLYIDRYVLYTNIGFALLLGVGLSGAVQALHALRDRKNPERPRGNPRSARVRKGVLLGGVTVTALVALLPVELGLRRPDSRVDDVMSSAVVVAAHSRSGDGVVFLPAARRDTALVTPRAFADLEDLALDEDPAASGTIKGIESAPDHIRAAMLARSRIVLVTDPQTPRPEQATAAERLKLSVLAEHFERITDVTTRGRRIEVYERTH
ncbi:glycosyltransferase family 39 protein [Streptomyces sp. MST-110588]|uniref:glycosyltransferase family 39 protein n=1 Tax=Streptomyces sp. MST-110588 TaxID=2833628 RepID=UPI001F5C2033|nr:glycosyltransferase family 39 protein [Streptomyces sp. MST-110588]UNO42295.1 glycosyltransferase family 39 protein [Streptomyces sp. MST-110588]